MSHEYWRRQFHPLIETSDMEECERCGIYAVVVDGKLEPHLYGVEDMQPCEPPSPFERSTRHLTPKDVTLLSKEPQPLKVTFQVAIEETPNEEA